MKRFYQSEWQGIKFSSIYEISEINLASEDFYNSFYTELFKKYKNFNELPETWRFEKILIANWISNQLQKENSVLSVGCGIGFIESYIKDNLSDSIELYVSDFASEALNWLKKCISMKYIFSPEEILKSEVKFDLIYFSAVDYAMPDESVISMLKSYKKLVKNSGCCLLISASFLEEKNLMEQATESFKDILKKLLRYLHIWSSPLGQFWGWKRSQKEYRILMEQAGFSKFEDGFIKSDSKETYFIKGYL